MSRLDTGRRVHLKTSTEPVNGTVTGHDRYGFTVRWDTPPGRRPGTPRNSRYHYRYSQAYAFGTGNRRAGEDDG